MAKLRQGYEANTATIANLFNFKDAGEGNKISDSTTHQAWKCWFMIVSVRMINIVIFLLDGGWILRW